MRLALACAFSAAIVAGCGSSGGGAPLAPPDAASLRHDVSAIGAAAAAHDPGLAHAATVRLRADIERLIEGGRLSGADGRMMLTAAGQVDTRIATEVPTPPAPAPPASPPGPGKGHGHGHGHGGGGDGGD